MKTLIENIKAAYERGSEYFEGSINGQEFKIRMNKDHACNWVRNDDQNIHNLSLINCSCQTGVGSRVVYGKLQKQVDNIRDWEDAQEIIEDFLFEINY